MFSAIHDRLVHLQELEHKLAQRERSTRMKRRRIRDAMNELLVDFCTIDSHKMRALRGLRGQKQVAAMIGMTQSTISAFENGNADKLCIATLIRLLELYSNLEGEQCST